MVKPSSPHKMFPRLVAIAVAGAVIIGLGYVVRGQSSIAPKPSENKALAKESGETAPAPKRTAVFDAKGGLLATFTLGSRTVLMVGPSRTFSEPGKTVATVSTTEWVRVYPTAFSGEVDKAWVSQMNAQNAGKQSPDLIQMAMQYIENAPAINDGDGQAIAGDASYGPLQNGGERKEGADFNDYLGIPFTYSDATDNPDLAMRGSLDSAGFIRMLWGYRNGLPLAQEPADDAIPRNPQQILGLAPGVVVVQNVERQITDFSRLQAGDIVFHDANSADSDTIDHVGMYLGLDSQGHRRFISSRMVADGPTFGDAGGMSVLDGSGLYAKSFRAIRRF